MSLKDRLIQEMKQAMKAKDQLRLDVIRLLRARIKNIEIDQGEIDDEQVQQVVQQQIKQWKDAVVDYEKGSREDLVEEAQQKIKILQEFLPDQLSDDELKKIIAQVKQETGLDQVGPLIGKVKQRVANQAEGSKIASLVQEMMNAD
jgi:uncharacterized protein